MNLAVDIGVLARLLEKCPRVVRLGSEQEPEAWALAHALADLAESCETISERLLPALAAAEDEQTLEDTLHEIGEELRHILYHVNKSQFYHYLQDHD